MECCSDGGINAVPIAQKRSTQPPINRAFQYSNSPLLQDSFPRGLSHFPLEGRPSTT